MDKPDPFSLSPFINGSFSKLKERTAFDQVATCKSPNMQRIIQLIHRAAQRCCLKACQFFCLPLDSLMCKKVTCCPAPAPKEERDTQMAIQSPPSTIMIINISNSTLINSVIGNNAYLSVTERQPLMLNGEVTEPASPPPLPPPPPPPLPSAEHQISIQSSHLDFVIIGDNNYMQAEQSQLMG